MANIRSCIFFQNANTPTVKIRKILTTLRVVVQQNTKRQKFNRQNLYAKFLQAHNTELVIHYCHIRNSAKEAAISTGIPNFKTITCFRHCFKCDTAQNHEKSLPDMVLLWPRPWESDHWKLYSKLRTILLSTKLILTWY